MKIKILLMAIPFFFVQNCTSHKSNKNEILALAYLLATKCSISIICDTFVNNGSHGGTVNAVDAGDGTIKVTSNGLPEHDYCSSSGKSGKDGDTSAGGCPNNPNVAKAQSNTYYIPNHYTTDPATVTSKTSTPLGPVTVAYDGAMMYNASDATTDGTCHRNVGYYEAGEQDFYGGHPQQQGIYHYHTGTIMKALTSDNNSVSFNGSTYTLSLPNRKNHSDGHSPIMGWSFDGYPVYGPYVYSNPKSSSSSVILAKSCWTLKTSRSCSPTSSSPPSVSEGPYIEDFTYTASLTSATDIYNNGGSTTYSSTTCHLDLYNMRYGVTPESPTTPIYFYVLTTNPEYAWTSSTSSITGGTGRVTIQGSISYPYIIGSSANGIGDFGGSPDSRDITTN